MTNHRFRKHPAYVRPALRSADAFRRYTEACGSNPPQRNARHIAAVIAQKHCAGRRGNLDGQAILDALRRDPDPTCETSGAIGWMLSSITIPECTKLAVRCGVRYEHLAAHLCARVQQRDDLVRYLNQFTVDTGGKDTGTPPGRGPAPNAFGITP